MSFTKRSLFVVLFGLLFIADCRRELPAGAASSAVTPKQVAVGAILPLSGENASFGTTARAAFELAEEDLRRARQNVPLLVYGDSRLDKDLALKEFRRLVDQQKVVAFAEVTGSGVAIALQDVAAHENIPMVSGVDTSPELSEGGGPMFFRVISSDAYSSEVLSKWVIGKGIKKAALVANQQNDWAAGFKSASMNAFRRQGGELPDEAVVTVTNDTVDFSPAISRLKKQNPQAIFVALMGRQAGLFVKQAVDKGLNGPFLGVDNLAQQEFAENAGPARTRALLVLPSEVKSEAGKQFEARFRAKTGREADGIAFKAYDSYMAVAKAIEAVQQSGQPVTGAKVQQALKNLKFDGLTGPIAFDQYNDLAESMYDRLTFDASGKTIPAT